jgi:hypothetical protein
MVGDPTASVIALLVVVGGGVVAALVKRARRDEILPPGKAREYTQRLARSHENLRKQGKRR